MDFNGIPLTRLAEEIQLDYNTLIDNVKSEVSNDIVSIQSSINPHIISHGHFDIETSKECLIKQKITKLKNYTTKSLSADKRN